MNIHCCHNEKQITVASHTISIVQIICLLFFVYNKQSTHNFNVTRVRYIYAETHSICYSFYKKDEINFRCCFVKFQELFLAMLSNNQLCVCVRERQGQRVRYICKVSLPESMVPSSFGLLFSDLNECACLSKFETEQ